MILKSRSPIRRWLTPLLFLLVPLIFFLVAMSFPRARTGPFGIGLPSDFVVFSPKHLNFTINYPKSWVAVETPQGSHGDMEVIAAILVPGRSFPQVYFAQHLLPVDSLGDVVDWGENRAMTRSNYWAISFYEKETANIQGMMQEFGWESVSPFGKTIILCKDLYLQNDNTGYAISFCAQEKHWEQFESVVVEMMNSLMFSPED